MKKIPKWLYITGLVIFGILAYFFITSGAQAQTIPQPNTFKSAIDFTGATYSSGKLTLTFTIPSNEAQYIQWSLGKADAQQAVNQIGDETKGNLRRLSERSVDDVKSKALPFLSNTTLLAGWNDYLEYKAYKDTLGTWEQTQVIK